jgi:hypothetical protein
MHNNPDTKTLGTLQFYLYQLQQKPQFKKNYNFMILNSDYKIFTFSIPVCVYRI